jgi:hypothetical protein
VVHVVTHTHWDREWYLPAGRFRQRLVALIDELLDAPPGTAEPFLLDGQAVVLDDYLAVCPERRADLAHRLRSGAIEAGPWYVLADELIPSGEALVRNLLIGRATIEALGAAPPPILYSPDAFGHPAALPMLALGFGYPIVILWRGYGGAAERGHGGDTARWRGPDGATVLVYHLPPDGYEFGSSLPADDRAAQERWSRIRDVLAPRAVLGTTLLLNGADHHALQPGRARALAALARAAAPATVRASSLRTFGADLEERAQGAQLPVIAGELRASYGYTWTLQGTFGSRALLKRRNAHAERLLVRDAEPWVALAALTTGRSRRALSRAAWKTLLLCHPHDTLCGCSIDEVARAMAARLDDAMAQAHGLREDALLDVIGHDREDARTRPADWRAVVVVRNRAARPRGGVAELEVRRVRQTVPVGPGSGGVPTVDRPPIPFALERDGAPVSFQVLGDSVRHDRVESAMHYPSDALVDAARGVAWLDPVPGYGTAGLSIRETGAASGAAALPGNVAPVRAGASWIDNGILRLEVEATGTVRLTSATHGIAIPALVHFEDVGDVGDLYTHSPAGPVLVAARALKGSTEDTRLLHAGPLRAVLETVWRLNVPISSWRDRRSQAEEPLTMRVTFSLDAGAPFLRVRVRGHNYSCDHRLRIVFSLGVESAAVWADAAFGPVRREPIVAPPSSAETPPATAPLARYVTLATGDRGVTVYSDGLAEYEATPGGDVAITLLRAVDELSRNDLPERPGHAGWPAPTPEAQSIGPFEGYFAIFPHGPRDASTIDLIERTADDVLLPLAGVTLRSALAVPATTHGVELEGEGLACSACKESEDGAWLVLRCVNLTDREIPGRWRIGKDTDAPIAEARLARLDETPGTVLPHAGCEIPFRAAPRAVVTILVRARRD